MKKIGIITFHRAHNYGAVLQCYALSHILSKMGYQVEVIDYYPSYLHNQYNLLPSIKNGIVLWFKTLIKLIPILNVKIKRMRLFNSFISSLPLSAYQYDENIDEIKGYDILIFGSDQIWNPLLSNGVDKVFSGFFKHDGTLFVSYAASTNPRICSDEYKHYFEKILNSFDRISVRENSLSNYLNAIRVNSSIVVLDPVLLLNKKEWSSIAISPKEENYLLIYTVPQSPLVRKHAEFIAKAKGLQIIEITPAAKNVRGKEYRQVVGPRQFLGYFQNASYVVTTSFHGTAFSIKFEKQFSNIQLGTPVDDRAYNLLEIVGLQEHAIPQKRILEEPMHINYSCIADKLYDSVHKSISYIRDSVNSKH